MPRAALAAALASALLAAPAGGRPEGAEPAGEVIVTAPRAPVPLRQVPAAVTVLDAAAELEARPAATLDEALSLVPGTAARGAANPAQDARLQVRGFGARAAFGIRGVTLVVDGFPETLPDGQAQVDSIDPEAVERIEVLRGLAASLYGNAAGGAVRLETLRPTAAPRLSLRALGGEGGLAKLHARATGTSGDVGWAAWISPLRSEGWRRRSRAEQTLAGAIVSAPAARGDLLLSLALADAPVADDPGGLTAAEVEADRRQASPQSVRFRTGEALRHARLGASWRGSPAPNQRLELAAWGSHRSFRSAIPFTVVELDRDAGGAFLRWSLRHGLPGAAFARLSLGAELQGQLDRRANRANEDGAAGDALTLSQDEGVTAVGLSAQEEVGLGRGLVATAGGRWDLTRFRARDRLLADGDASGVRRFEQPTGRLGLAWSPAQVVAVYAAATQAYEVPTTTELVNLSQGGFDPDLRPQRAAGLEAGARAGAGAWSVDVAAFAVRVRDGLVRQEDAAGRAYYVNASRSRTRGVELAASGALPLALRIRAAWTWLDARFEAYAPRGEPLDGNRVPGIPRHALAVELGWGRARGPTAAVELRTAGDWVADDENRVREGLAWLVGARAAWPFRAAGATFAPFLSVENALSAEHSDTLRLNAAGGRYFEPAAPRQVRGGLSVAWEGRAAAP